MKSPSASPCPNPWPPFPAAATSVRWGLALILAAGGPAAGPLRSVAAEPDATAGSLAAETLPYADPAGGREGRRDTGATVNQYRLYDFYARQAEHHLDGAEMPPVLPPFPGLDGGRFGHWGRFHQNDHVDGRWDRMESGRVVGAVVRGFGATVTKGVAVKLGRFEELSACFDPESLVFRSVWSPGFVRFGDRRWGLVEGVEADGEPVLETRSSPARSVDYRGYFLHGERVVFDYLADGVRVLDAPWAIYSKVGRVFTRTLAFPDGVDELAIPLFTRDPGLDEREVRELAGGVPIHVLWGKDAAQAAAWRIAGEGGFTAVGFEEVGDGLAVLRVRGGRPGARLKVYLYGGNRATLGFFEIKVNRDGGQAVEDPAAMTRGGGGRRWDWAWTEAGRLGTEDRPWVVDVLPVPLENPFGSPMFLSGHDFLPDGRAVVCTMMGDVWLVSGIDDELTAVTWRRFAAGLHQPMGIDVAADGVIHVLGKDQITRLHDLDGDGEADRFENFCNRFATSPGGHDYQTGLQRDGEGRFHFASGNLGVCRVSADGRELSILATGIRNPNGIGASRDGLVTTSTQEGDGQPASMVIEVHAGEQYGFRAGPGDPIAPPLAYVPRGIDHSSSGQVFVESPRWGPLRGQLVGLSFGAGTHYLVLRDAEGGRAQGAVVPLPGEFRAGPNRGRFRPLDGQLYVTCSDGWGDYALQDGSFERVRFTGRPADVPVGFRVHANGLQVTFTRPLDREAAEDVTHWFCQQWNYLYSPAYGSPEFSVRHPGVPGHDPVTVRSAHLLGDGRTVFLEIPDLRPVMQFHVHGRMRAADGREFTADLYPTLVRLGPAFDGAPGLAPSTPGELRTLEIAMVAVPAPPGRPGDESRRAGPPGRPVAIRAVNGLRFDTEAFRVSPGERISLTLGNEDVIPHNLVILAEGLHHVRTVGELANRMVSEPDAVERHYVPDSPAVLFHTRVIQAGEADTIDFTAPATPGHYPFVCTFPGHWMLMRGTMVVQ